MFASRVASVRRTGGGETEEREVEIEFLQRFEHDTQSLVASPVPSVYHVKNLETVLPPENDEQRWARFPDVQRPKTKFLDAFIADLVLFGAPSDQEIAQLTKETGLAYRWTGVRGDEEVRRIPDFVSSWVS
uniref:Uncharacterized protein n=1 Tax=Chromera velia CCMP2878 TaxID=1169474 RepID=A0A0G4HJD3_9ALVE|eukprot:Cvel_28100.t1-p1 / transcript=Cvel_28100.t1 / gene=Cvel_28100 / organism=Chromera_velia_CCMP2878 / gene_product=hypothetical protein / transcript_product=hypothetical protein / location=Cvel_scaffold3618:6692-7905(-) / protein_length=130 / sequence_SO=supercontig / SO=protein_coding / is_pseudo=false